MSSKRKIEKKILAQDQKSQNAFTLMELLVTVAIIGILATMAMQQYHNFREKAELSATITAARDLYTSGESYYAKNLSYTSCTSRTNCNSVLGTTISDTHIGLRYSASNNASPQAVSCHNAVRSLANGGAGKFFYTLNSSAGLREYQILGCSNETQ